MKRFVFGLLVAASLASCARLATAVVAQGSEGRAAVERTSASTTAASFCTDLQTKIRSQILRFSGWRCKPGPTVRGMQTILAWVKLTRRGGTTNLDLIWLAKIEPVTDAVVIDLLDVPRYGYEPSNVRRAFQIAAVTAQNRGQVSRSHSLESDVAT